MARRTLACAVSAVVLAVLAVLGPSATVFADVAPDPTNFGPLQTTVTEYKFDAAIDPDVLPIRPTELWAAVFRPDPLDAGPYPLLVFLHGNHFTCGYGENPRIDDSSMYTFTGTCPANHVVVPNHRGYGYIAERLASWGYIVVSINANRGINAAPGTPEDLGLNLARGRLVLKHLQRLTEWNRDGGAPDSLGVDLKGKIDFTHVGFMGHSRGGEGARAAYNLYQDPNDPNPINNWMSRIPVLNVQGIFEIGPVDGQTSRQLNASGTVWNVLLPMCDGDVSNLQGVKPFDRMMLSLNESPATQKSTFTVWGANHNYYNTEWQTSDSVGCHRHEPLWSTTVGSPEQQQTGLAGVMAFFRGNVGPDADPAFNQNFNPQYDLPPVVTSVTRVDRGFTDSPNSTVTKVFEDFDKPTGINTYGFPNDASNITITHGPVPDHGSTDPYGRVGIQRAGAIKWTASGFTTFFQTNWRPAGSGMDISGYKTLDLRLSRQDDSANVTDSTSFSVRLAMADGSLSNPVSISLYTDLTGPVGGLFFNGTPNPHPILQTARIGLADFGATSLASVRGIRLTFEDTPSGAIYAANVRLSTKSGSPPTAAARARSASAPAAPPSAAAPAQGSIVSVHTVTPAAALAGQPGVEITVTSPQGFPAQDELAVLQIADLQAFLSVYSNDGDMHQLTFVLTPDQWARAVDGASVSLRYGRDTLVPSAVFGPLDKRVLDR